MIIVIIAGGSGTRLWPLSTHDYPKHLLKLTGERSLLQNTYDRVRPLTNTIFVVTEKSHSKYVHQQLPEIPGRNILAEPARRGTASCFVLALSEIKRRRLPDQAVFFLWGDHFVQDVKAFQEKVNQAGSLAEAENKLVFMGMKPTYPSTGLGYIFKGKKIKRQNGAFALRQFVEKPNKKTAELYFKDGRYLWNTGYLIGTVKTFEKELREHAPRLWNGYLELNRALLPMTRKKYYLHFVSEAIDTALSEHIPDAITVEAGFDWLDVGNFRDLYDVSRLDKTGNHTNGKQIELDSVTNSFVRNDTDIPVAVIGLDDVAVIATENGILVTKKADAQKVGDISKRLQAQDKRVLSWLDKL